MPAKYELIADELRQKILSGELTPGDRVPGESILKDQYKVSVPTVRQALAVLRHEGLIEARHGVGTYVRTPRIKVRRTDERHQWEKNRVREPESVRRSTGATEYDTGLSMPELVFSARYTTTEAHDGLADAFGIPVGTKLLQRDYRTQYRSEDAPFSLVRSYLVYEVVEANPDLLDEDNEPWPGGTQHQLSTIGIELVSITEEVHTRMPSVQEAEELGIPNTGVPVFDLRRISIDVTGRVVEVADIILPGDRSELIYTTKLNRWS
ncbi:GntR family transcriptional regulator [Nocardia otitidiscaviarum]|uniref:GntR family transcriptional regulator n=1 Tax=Nocardia otitidiscaviarum TaxID=1823 RepID=UPI0018957E02|nr:GntR family transcriptional regulator [Nocardia otitidiscaviarum]MBF6179907.1 GntR family transcriptional regulator [Nocardia otitidiscaviarum]